MNRLFNDLLDLAFPRKCPGCLHPMLQNEKVLCASCFIDLPETGYLNDYDNPVARMFWGRVQIEHATAFLQFKKGTKVQSVMHHIKYKGQKDIGLEMGRLMGKKMHEALHAPVDIVVPVPLHPSKERKRGYNQSAVIAQGIAEALNKPVDERALKRRYASESQTRKGRYNRWLNTENMYGVSKPGQLEGKHILLVDDVITTGATLEACAQAILQETGAKVSIVTLAVSVK